MAKAYICFIATQRAKFNFQKKKKIGNGASSVPKRGSSDRGQRAEGAVWHLPRDGEKESPPEQEPD